jgi:hypothetical protein
MAARGTPIMANSAATKIPFKRMSKAMIMADSNPSTS